jgi:hypothetical protein
MKITVPVQFNTHSKHGRKAWIAEAQTQSETLENCYNDMITNALNTIVLLEYVEAEGFDTTDLKEMVRKFMSEMEMHADCALEFLEVMKSEA